MKQQCGGTALATLYCYLRRQPSGQHMNCRAAVLMWDAGQRGFEISTRASEAVVDEAMTVRFLPAVLAL